MYNRWSALMKTKWVRAFVNVPWYAVLHLLLSSTTCARISPIRLLFLKEASGRLGNILEQRLFSSVDVHQMRPVCIHSLVRLPRIGKPRSRIATLLRIKSSTLVYAPFLRLIPPQHAHTLERDGASSSSRVYLRYHAKLFHYSFSEPYSSGRRLECEHRDCT